MQNLGKFCDFTKTVIIYISTHDPPVFIHTFKNIVIVVLHTHICGFSYSLHIVTSYFLCHFIVFTKFYLFGI